MEYIAYSKDKKQMYLRDGITQQTNRVTLDVTQFSYDPQSNCYVFAVNRHPNVDALVITLPVQNTVLIYV